MKKVLATSLSSAYQLFRKLCDPTVEGDPYLMEQPRPPASQARTLRAGKYAEISLRHEEDWI